MEEKIKVYIFPILLIVLFAGAVYTSIQPINNAITGYNKNGELIEQQKSLSETLESIKREKAQKNNVDIEGSKVVYENQEFNFSKDASFAPLIEKFIDISKLSGVRIHSIDYNYAPVGDPVFDAQNPGYNVCELSVTAAGHYNNFQKLFETIIADANIMNLSMIDIAPWEANYSILVGKFKLRLYTKTM